MVAWHMLVAILTAVAPATPAAEPTTPPENYVRNSGLEEPVPPDALPAGWIGCTSPNSKFASRLGDTGHVSAHAWVIEGQGEWGGVVAGRARVAPELRFTGGGWCKVTGPGQATIKLDYYAADDNLITSTLLGLVSEKDGWQHIQIVEKRPSDPGIARIGLTALLLKGGQALFDDLFLRAAPADPADAENLLLNGHLESAMGDRPACFTVRGYPGEKPVWEYTDQAAHSGQRGLHLSGDTTYIILFHDPVPVSPLNLYQLSGWVRSRKGEAVLKLDYLDKQYKWLGQQTSRAAATDGQWHEITMAADFGDYPTAEYVAAAVFATEPGTDADFDDLRLISAGVPTARP